MKTIISKIKSIALRIACHYIRNTVISQMKEKGWTQSEKNPAHWNTPELRWPDGVKSSSSIHEANAAAMLVKDIINGFYKEGQK